MNARPENATAILPGACRSELPEDAAALSVEALKPGAGPQLVFSALDSSIAGEAELEFAAAGHIVVSNSRNHRMDALVPLLIPEVNPEHLGLLPLQKKIERLERRDRHKSELRRCASGDGAGGLARLFNRSACWSRRCRDCQVPGYPGVASLDATANVIPYH